MSAIKSEKSITKCYWLTFADSDDDITIYVFSDDTMAHVIMSSMTEPKHTALLDMQSGGLVAAVRDYITDKVTNAELTAYTTELTRLTSNREGWSF